MEPVCSAGSLYERARAYPFARPDGSFLFHNGSAELRGRMDVQGRRAVLAIGANAAPERLLEKFGRGAVIPVEKVLLLGYVVVYSAHITSYGSIPLTLRAKAGAVSGAFITHLDEAQIARMDETEPNYERVCLGVCGDIARPFEEEGGALHASKAPIHAYVGRWGCLLKNGSEMVFPDVGQDQALARVRDLTAPERELGLFVVENVLDAMTRNKRIEALRERAGPSGISLENQ